jgi:hypothetical protein
MSAGLGRVIGDYRGLVETCQQRAVELGLSRLEIDRLSGLPSGYSGKVLGNGNSTKPKRLWPVGLEAMLGALGLKILLIEDEGATARTLALRAAPVDSSSQRFNNRNNCGKPSLKIENVASIKITAPQTNEPPAMRSHLRVIQDRRRGSKWG